jgi:hypothetical protein
MVWLKYVNKLDFYELKNGIISRNMINLRYHGEYKNRLRFDIVIKDWNNYNGKMLWYNSKIIEIEIFKNFKMV